MKLEGRVLQLLFGHQGGASVLAALLEAGQARSEKTANVPTKEHWDALAEALGQKVIPE